MALLNFKFNKNNNYNNIEKSFALFSMYMNVK